MKKINIEDLTPDPEQPRKNRPESHFRSLAASIANEGLNNPIIIRENPDGGYWIVNGECRHTSFMFIKEYWDGKPRHGWEFVDGEFTVDCIVREFASPEEILKNQVMDNIMRLEMGPLETLEAISKLMENFTAEECGKSFGISEATILADLPILTLPKDIQSAWDQGKCTKIVARKLASLPERQHSAAWDWCKNSKTTEMMLAKIEGYIASVNQLDIFSELMKNSSDSDKKDARVLFGKMYKCMTSVAGSPLLNSHSKFMIAANAAKTEQIEATANTMVKIADTLLSELKVFKARKKSA